MATADDLERARIPAGCLVYPLVDLEKTLRPFDPLSQHNWIRIESMVSNDDEDTVISRVFVLPDDSYNDTISRTDPQLREKRQALLLSLDYSSVTWNGLTRHDGALSSPVLSPRAKEARESLVDNDADEDMSLLEMFNTIPSPRPDVRSVADGLPKKVMSKLLSSTVEGITTEMYPYQCRSAALMYQKEVQSGQVLDPRLVEVMDQDGKLWYYNSVDGSAFREPCYYDEVHGGILAEEMGSGKTLICLALIAATRYQPAAVPDLYQGNKLIFRRKLGSLMDMAATVATHNAAPWKGYIDSGNVNCIRALERNLGSYCLPLPEVRKPGYQEYTNEVIPRSRKIYLSHATLVVVPVNLLKQWEQEISKHTSGLRTLSVQNNKDMPPAKELVYYDIILCTVNYLEGFVRGTNVVSLGLIHFMHFKRCIVDEGNKIGNVKLHGPKTSILQLLDSLQITARWIVTGTPSKGLFGTEEPEMGARSFAEHESKDLERIGAIATWYLKARPWSNTVLDDGDIPLPPYTLAEWSLMAVLDERDTLADWRVYVMQPKHSSKSKGSHDCLRSSLNSLVVRHRLPEVSLMLPTVEAKVVKLEGSYQDKLSMNLFSMIIIFNAVQSQRQDQDYFFHQRNRKSLLQMIHNLRQASFFGGQFFTSDEIQRSVEEAEEFLDKREVPITDADENLLRAAIAFGKVAVQNAFKKAANLLHEMPIQIRDFPGGMGADLSIAPAQNNSVLVRTNRELIRTAQAVWRYYLEQNSKAENNLAGNRSLGEDHVSLRKLHDMSIKDADKGFPTPSETPGEDPEIAVPLAATLISTCSAKLSYLVDAIVKHQGDEKILIFYENNNVAWYLAEILEILQVHHLIYAQGISADRRSQYISTFNNNSKSRVMLVDISQAAFGLVMRSASRIYFINPVLNPQVEARAIGRVRQISQQMKVTVETLVLRDSLEEVIMERQKNMTRAEHRSCKSILDDKTLYEWILNPRIIPLPDVDVDDWPNQMAPLAVPLYILNHDLGRGIPYPDDDILLEDPPHTAASAKAKGKRSAENDEPQNDRDTGRPRPMERARLSRRIAFTVDLMSRSSLRRNKSVRIDW